MLVHWLSAALLCVQQAPEDYYFQASESSSDPYFSPSSSPGNNISPSPDPITIPTSIAHSEPNQIHNTSSIKEDNETEAVQTEKEIEMKRIQFNKYNISFIILEKMSHNVTASLSKDAEILSSSHTPAALKLILASIKRIVLSIPNLIEENNELSSSSPSSSSSSASSTNNSESVLQERIKLFNTSMSAVLFLRLANPALISPGDWGLFSAWKFDKPACTAKPLSQINSQLSSAKK